MSRLAMLSVCVWIVVLAGGCAAKRPVESIRESGTLHYTYGRYDDAANEFSEIVSRYPGDWEAQYMLGLTQQKRGDLTSARRALEIAHTRKPANEDVADALAEVMYEQQDLNRLFAFLRERAETTKTAPAFLRLARYAMDTNDADTARWAYDRAIEVDAGSSVEPYVQAAAFHERVGDMEGAVRRLRQAYGIDAYDVRVNDRLRALGEVPGPSIALPPGV